MTHSVLNSLAELCTLKGVLHAVICPGSRSAPLTLAFTRNKKITCWTFSDERSAGFIALGMAQQTQSPVVLICTSGSAAFNFAPAVAEAYFSHTPLIVFTADRPKEWIDQFDGQTIHQPNLYGSHVKKYFELPQEYGHPDAIWHANRIVNDAINLANENPPGPIHINAPLREPLYPKGVDADSITPRVIEPGHQHAVISVDEIADVKTRLSNFKKILVVSGQHAPADELIQVLQASGNSWPIAGDILSNLHGVSKACLHSDTFLGQLGEEQKSLLQPDLLITFGDSLVSKNLKLFLRRYQPKEQWHLQEHGIPADTFQSLTRVIRCSPLSFFRNISTEPSAPQAEFYQRWVSLEEKVLANIESFFQRHHDGEFSAVKKIIEALPSDCNLHLANSMTVRYANHIGLKKSKPAIRVHCNRGTSGIDGSSSTAAGHALTSKAINVLITGDLAFFYDQNAFWHNYPLANLLVVVLNNHGGVIFNLIDGPAGMPEAEEFFITRQKRTARFLAGEFGFSYATNFDPEEFFRQGNGAKILEVESSQEQSKNIFEEFKNQTRL